MAVKQFRQDPAAIVGFACRLPGGNRSPQMLWDFLEQGGVASNKVPKSRFNIDGHYDGSHKPGTIRPKGGMFIEDVDLAEFDASFFEIGATEAIAMDPNQRQMLEVVFEALENAGIPLNKLSGARVACYVGSYASDYGDIQSRDPENRPANCAVGVGRAIMANRLSYFLNIKGPSITIDTACSGSLVGLDLACKAIQSGEVDAAIIAASNLYLNPEHAMDVGNVGQAHSPSGLCHVFDIDADGYVKAEAVSCVIIKRLSDTIRDRDPIRAIVRGTASNSNGRTGGIASPSSEAQADAIRTAYANAGITNLSETAYVECHGTGTQAGDPAELEGLGSVFSDSCSAEEPLLIGSIKSNVGHSEPAAGNSGLIKVIMSMERGVVPGTPLFIKPNPKIDFRTLKVKAFRTALPWPDKSMLLRRASINSFGYGGSNAHAIIEQPSVEIRNAYVSSYKSAYESEGFDEEDFSPRPYLIIISANDAYSLTKSINTLSNHLANPRVQVGLEDLAFTLSEHRTRHWHRAFLTTHTTEINEADFTVGRNSGKNVRVAFIFTGQGAQWVKMGEELLRYFPWTRSILEQLDCVLQAQPDPPQWSLITELTQDRNSEHIRQPEISQSITTALQLCIITVLQSWGVKPTSVVGHSSGEIAAAYMAGLIDLSGAIKAAFYRGRAAASHKHKCEVGMLAVGLGLESVTPFLAKYSGSVSVACFNSPSSLTISGEKHALIAIAKEIKAAGQFARLLQVDLAYHSEFMAAIGNDYQKLLALDKAFRPREEENPVIAMFSSVTGSRMVGVADASYWKANMVSPVRFDKALTELITKDCPNFIIEVGPSGALAGPVSQVLKSLPNGQEVAYHASWARGANSSKALFNVAGQLFLTGANINVLDINKYNVHTARTIIDLPNYSWNHTVKYWHENTASTDWRHKQFITHDLLGSKIPGTLWETPTWCKHLQLHDVPWLRDHKMGSNILMPGAGMITLAVEAMFQKHSTLNNNSGITSPNELSYRFRNIKFERAIVLEESITTLILLTLSIVPGNKDWHDFRIRTKVDGAVYDHCSGLVRIQSGTAENEVLGGKDFLPLRYPESAKLWYKTQKDIGMDFGPAFQKIESFEYVSGSRKCRAIVSLEPPTSKWEPQSYYPIHPAVLDCCLQTATPANAAGERSSIKDVMIPAAVDDMIINRVPKNFTKGLSVAESVYTGRGREDVAKSWTANIAVHDPHTGALFMRVKGLNYVRLDTDERPDSHVFHTVTWKPDVAFINTERLASLFANTDHTMVIHSVIDLVAYKTPSLKVFEINLDNLDTSSLWFEGGDESVRAGYTAYDVATRDAEAMMSIQKGTEGKRNTSYYLISPTSESLGLAAKGSKYDLIIIKAPSEAKHLADTVMQSLENLVSNSGFIIVLALKNMLNSKESLKPKDARLYAGKIEKFGEWSPELPSRTTDVPLPEGAEIAEEACCNSNDLRRLALSCRPSPPIIELPLIQSNLITACLLCHDPLVRQNAVSSQVIVPFFHDSISSDIMALLSELRVCGLNVNTVPIEQLAANCDSDSTVLVLDELTNPVLINISEDHWNALKQVITRGQPVAWITKASQMGEVSEPSNALVHGLFRVIRKEEPQTRLTTLDVESALGPSTPSAIQQVLQKLDSGVGVETEYAERGGVIYLQRVRPDATINDFKAADSGKGFKPEVRALDRNLAQVRLLAEKVGSLRSLTWCEIAPIDVSVAPGMVEIEIMAIGVNFKDVVTTMGIVPENEHMIGCECAGFIKRIAPGLQTCLKVGDRVVAMRSGTYANQIQCPHERVHVIPDSMSFKNAATIPLAFLTAIYSLYHLGNLKEGQSVLIHSATGGVGIAAIQLAQYKKCDIFVTVGTESKRAFLSNRFGIPENRIFSSRSTDFAGAIRRETGGRGVDIIMNSLVGELLDESWRLIADGGIMIEIGKKDIVDRNSLAMEPFDRNCSFRAVDLSYVKEISDKLIGKLLAEIFGLVKGGHIGPIFPVTTYRFDQVVEALTYMSRSQHIGKIVVSREEGESVRLNVKPAIPKLKLDSKAVYIIVGGLKGLCGSLAVHMARHSAREIIVISRSGLGDDTSAKAIANCAAYGCQITDAKGDIGDLAFVQSVFENTQPKRIAGLIQGAMVLRDKPYETMTHDDYHTAIYPKVVGTWNLHNAALNSQKEPLEFFTMLSSLSSIVGNKGQANYAAANSFLDAFTYYRLARGLHANTINLGVIEDVGYVAEQGGTLNARFGQSQWGKKPLSSESKAQLITGLVYPLVPDASDLTQEPRFSYLFSRHNSQESAGEKSEADNDHVAEAIRAFYAMRKLGTDSVTLAKAALSLLMDQITKVLGLKTEMDPGKPLQAYGLDSLAAAELRGWGRQKLGAELSTLDITNSSSLYALSEKLVSKLPALDE
ncbi:putative polyketide synthase [Xylaria arbuscula]|nr:putative polyketide synthase [Xylaria arbuscula]